MRGPLHAALPLLALLAVPAFAQGAPGGGPGGRGPGGPGGGGSSNVVDSVAVTGNAKVASSAIMPVVTLKPGTTLSSPAQIKPDLQAIIALYRSKGYDLAISPDIQHPAPGHVTVTYKIDENGKGGDAGAAPPAGGRGGPGGPGGPPPGMPPGPPPGGPPPGAQ